MKFKYYYTLLILVCSCGQKSDNLQLEILSDQLYFSCPSNDCKNAEMRLKDDYLKNSNNILKFKLTNNSNEPYLFIPICEDYVFQGCSSKGTFPEKFTPINENSLMLFDEKGNLVKTSDILVYRVFSEVDVYHKYTDSIVNSYYENTGYKDKSLKWKFMNSQISNAVVIHPKETIFFETYFNLPMYINMSNSVIKKFHLNPEQSYSLKLKFNSDIKNIENWLTDSQLSTYKENEYQFYREELISTNSIPVSYKK